MSDRPKGKHFSVDANSPMARGLCDKTGFVFRYVDLVKQMEWRGNSLQWTGFMVGKPYADVPNEQLRTILFPPDPVPVTLPRPYRPSVVVWENQNIFWENLEASGILSWESWFGTEDGVIAAPEDERLSALEQGIQPPTRASNTNISQSPQLTQQQIQQSLQNFNWSNTSGTLP